MLDFDFYLLSAGLLVFPGLAAHFLLEASLGLAPNPITRSPCFEDRAWWFSCRVVVLFVLVSNLEGGLPAAEPYSAKQPACPARLAGA